MFNNSLLNKFNSLKTPFYYYDLDILKNNISELISSLEKNNKVHFALKSNSNIKLLEIIKSSGIGIDAVSSNEIKRAIEVGFLPRDVVFAGVGKTDDEIHYALQNDISYLNCESFEEIDVINEISKKINKKAEISIRINPSIKTGTHRNIETGNKNNKFGIDLNDIGEILERIKVLNNISVVGFHFHLGSQIDSDKPFFKLCEIANEMNDIFYLKNLNVKYINVGGGLSIDYKDPMTNQISNFKNFFKIFNQNLKLKEDQNIHFELGRSIIGQCGFLVSKVLFNKKSFGRNYLIVDAGMNDLMRPALYNSYHKILNISSNNKDFEKYDVVGPVCESSDVFATNYKLPISSRNDHVVICSTGAYGESMSSNYNLRNSLKSYFSDSI
tara:strand:- start:13187 stop:14341 length:1155 start_codon:yes stop_codon:yes gene_type:complete